MSHPDDHPTDDPGYAWAVQDSYSGIENLEAMECAHNYRSYLGSLIREAAGPPRSGLRLLDFGAGVGTYARLARDNGYVVDCVETDAQLGAQLKSEGFRCVPDLAAYPDEAFDVVYTLNVLEHLEDDRAALMDMRRVLKPSARLLVYVPAFNILFSDMDTYVGHLRRYRRSQLIELVSSAGFRVEEYTYADSLGFAASLVYRVTRGKGTLTARSVSVYDKYVFPCSLVMDRLTGRFFGKNLALLASR